MNGRKLMTRIQSDLRLYMQYVERSTSSQSSGAKLVIRQRQKLLRTIIETPRSCMSVPPPVSTARLEAQLQAQLLELVLPLLASSKPRKLATVAIVKAKLASVSTAAYRMDVPNAMELQTFVRARMGIMISNAVIVMMTVDVTIISAIDPVWME